MVICSALWRLGENRCQSYDNEDMDWMWSWRSNESVSRSFGNASDAGVSGRYEYWGASSWSW